MELNGSYKIKATQQQVFQALQSPEVLKHCIPGCHSAEHAEFETGREIKLSISPNFPGLKGPYTIFLKLEDVVAPSHLALTTSPSSSMGSVTAKCNIDVIPEGETTQLNYNATAALTGKLAATPEILIKPAVKGALEHFFKHFEKQVSSIPA